MRKSVLFAGLFLVLAHWNSGRAQVLDLPTCLQMADTANLQIRNANLDVLINERQREAYLASRMPQLNFNADYKYNAVIPGQVIPASAFGGPAGVYNTVKFGVPYILSNNLQLTQILFNSQVNYGLAALKINSELVGTQRDIAVQEVRYQVSNTFFILQGIYQQLKFIDSNIVHTRSILKNMELTLAQGLIIQTEVDKIKINELSLMNAKSNLLASKDQMEYLLKILIGLPINANLELSQDVLVQKTILKEVNAPNLLTLNLIESQRKLNQEEGKGIRMSYLPNLNFYGIYNYNINLKPEDNFRKGIPGAFIGLRMDWSLFSGMERINKSKINQLNLEKIDNQYELANQQLDYAINQNKRQITVKAESLELSKEQLRLAENVHNNARLKFNEGLISSNDLIMAETGLEQAQSNLVSAYIQLRQAELEYLKSIGNIK
ncbi:MAG: TolC family protein [Flavobacteriales bacterium]